MLKYTYLLLFTLLASCANYSLLQQKRAAVGVVVQCDKGSWIGSGVILSNKHIVTAKHVLKCKTGVYTVFIKTYDGVVTEAILDQEVKEDVARLFVSHYDFRNNVFFSETINVKDIVCAVYPNRGYKQSCGEVVKKTESKLFINMDVDFGDSGSPVFNADGQVVGIIVARTQGLAEAVPVQAWQELIVVSEPNMFGEWP